MADNVLVDNVSEADYTVKTQDRAGVHLQQVIETGNDTISASRVNVTTTSASAVAARADRRRVILLALTSNTDVIDIGASGVASGSGFPLSPGDSVTLFTVAAIHADAASGTQVLAVIEEYEA